MSSTLRMVAQIPSRIKYLAAVAAGSTTNIDPTNASCFGLQFTTLSAIPSESLVAYTSGDTYGDSTGFDYAAGDLMKDLGRQLVFYDADTKEHLAIFRQVQLVRGAAEEGVPATYPVATFVKVWSAAGTGVRVARTGPGAY